VIHFFGTVGVHLASRYHAAVTVMMMIMMMMMMMNSHEPPVMILGKNARRLPSNASCVHVYPFT